MDQLIQKYEKPVIIFTLLLAFYLRFNGLDWGLPHHFHSDEDVMMYWGEQIRKLPIHELTDHQYFFVYGPLPLYWAAAGGHLINLFDPIDYQDSTSISCLYLWARSFSAILGSLTVFFIFLIGKTFSNHLISTIAALIAALTPIHVQHSHFFTAEVPFTFFATLFLFFALKYLRQPSYKYAFFMGIALSLTASCKMTAIAFVPVVIAVLILDFQKKKASTRYCQSFKSLLVFLASSVVIYFIINPWIFLNFENFINTYHMLNEWSSGIKRPLWTAQFTGLIPGVYWLTNLIPFSYTLPIMSLSIISLLTFSNLFRSQLIVLWIYFAGYYALVGFSYMQYIRYVVPLLPFIALSAAIGYCSISHFLEKKLSRFTSLISLIILSGFLFPSMTKSLALNKIYTQKDIRIEAAEWLHTNYEPGTVVATDNSAFRPPLGSELQRPIFNQGLVLRGDPYREKKDYFLIKLLDTYNYLYSKNLNSTDRLNYIAERLENVKLIILSEEAIVQYHKLTDKYPEVNSFFDSLFSNSGSFRLRKIFYRKPHFMGIYWNDKDIELTFRLFDHPIIYIFERKNTVSCIN